MKKFIKNFNEKRYFKSISTTFLLFDYLGNHLRLKQKAELSTTEVYFNAILNYIHKNYADNISISDIATANNIDRTYVFKLFQKYLKISPSQYLQQYRLSKACTLLRKTSLSITDISYTVGFNMLLISLNYLHNTLERRLLNIAKNICVLVKILFLKNL